MIKLSIIAFVVGLAFSAAVYGSVMAQTETPTPVVPTSAPSTGRG